MTDQHIPLYDETGTPYSIHEMTEEEKKIKECRNMPTKFGNPTREQLLSEGV